jgi:hypothetical protein
MIPIKLEQMVKKFKMNRCALDFDFSFCKEVFNETADLNKKGKLTLVHYSSLLFIFITLLLLLLLLNLCCVAPTFSEMDEGQKDNYYNDYYKSMMRSKGI